MMVSPKTGSSSNRNSFGFRPAEARKTGISLGILPKAGGFSPVHFLFSIFALVLGFWLFSGPLLACTNCATQFYVTQQSNPAGPGGNFNVGAGITFIVSAVDGSGNTDTAYSKPVSVGFYDTFTSLLDDPQALLEGKVPIDASASTGTALVTFNAGAVTIGAILRTGATSEQFVIQDNATPLLLNYPLDVNSQAFHVTGFSTQYYLQDANMDNSPAVYTAGTSNYDNLLDDPTTLTSGLNASVTIPFSSSVTNAAAYVTVGIDGGYAQAGAPISPNLWFQKPVGAGTTPVSIWVILDYGNGPSGPITDYNNPPAYTTVYSAGALDVAQSPGFTKISTASPVGGHAVLGSQQFMTKGQVIVRVWAPSAGTTLLMRYQNATVGNLSSLIVPYSGLNTQPVKGVATPVEFLAGAGPTTLNYVISNPSFAGITFVRYDIPANPAGNWNFTSLPTTVAGYTGSTVSYTNASGSTPGGVTVIFPGGNSMAINTAVTIAMVGTASSATTNFDFGNMAVTANGVGEPNDTSGASVTTLGAPSVPGSLTASPANYTGGGGQVSLSWPQITDQGANGYIISRRSPAGSGAFTAFVTIGSNAILTYTDSSALNLTSYDYTVAAKNNVTQSAPVTSNAVTAFANPGIASPVTALTGGTTIQLSWSAPASVPGSYAVTGYQIWRDTQASMATAVSLASAASSPYNDKPLAAGTTYYYAIASADSQYSGGVPGTAHISGFSVTVSGNPPGNPPSMVGTPVLLNSSPATLQVNWTPPSNLLNPPGGAPTNYYLYRAVTTGSFAAYVTLGGGVTSYNDTAVTAGSYYVYEVQAVDSLGVTSNPSGAVTGRVGPPPPATPTVYPSGTGVTLVWPAVANSVGETVVNYVVERSSSQIAFPVTTAAGSMTYTDGGITAGTDYYYQVAAVDQNSVTGGFSGAVTSALLPPAPVSLGVSLNLTNDNVAVTWATPVPAEPNLSTYTLTQSLNGAAATTITTPAGSAVSYLDASITSANAGQTVAYKLYPQNDVGGVGASSSVSIVVPPNAPTGLVATASASAITLNWTGRPAGEGVTQYTVYRVSPGPITAVAGSTASGAVSNLTDNSASLLEGTNYIYFVAAKNPGGYGLNSTTVTSALLPLVPATLTAAVSGTGAQFNVDVTWSAPVSSGNLTGYNLLRNTTPSLAGATALVTAGPPGTTNYADTQASGTAGTTFFYFAQGINPGGSGPTTMVGFQVPPNPPVGLIASSTSSSVAVTWQGRPASENVSNYTLYRIAPGPTTVTVGSTGSGGVTTLTDSSGLAEGVTYQYYVTATNPGGGAGVPGGPSLPSATLAWGLSPLLPTGLNVSSIDTSNNIGLTWTNVTGGSPNATGVTLFNNTSNSLGTATATNLAVSAVTYNYAAQTPDTTYYYWLETVNPFGTSAPAGPVSQLTYPAAASLVYVQLNSNGSRSVSWVTVGSGDVGSYNIYREQVGGSSFVSMGSVSAAGLTFPVTLTNPVLPGKQYIYMIKAVNGTGEGMNANFVTIGAPPSDPSQVTGVSGLGTSVQVGLSWPPNAAGEGVTGYAVYRGASAAWSGAVSIGASGVTNYTDTGISGPATYYYWVEAVGSDGTQSLPTTASSSATVLAYALPNTPTGLGETDGNASVTLSWTGVAATSYPVTGYNLYDAPNGGATVKANATPVAGTSYPVTGLANTQTYVLWVQTVDGNGNLSALSTPVTAYPAALPAAPANVGVQNGDSAEEITWNASVSAPGSLPVSFYQIEKVDLSGPATSFIQAAANLTGYVDSGLVNSQSYVYSVEAVDSTGITVGTHVSGYSAPITGVPGSTPNPPGNVVGTGGVGQVTVSWTTAFTGLGGPVTGYQIFRAQVPGGYSAVATVGQAAVSFVDSPLTNGVTYSYYLQSVISGTTSAASATVYAVPALPPAAPTALSTLDSGQEVLSWTASPNQGVVTISQYYVQSSVNGGAAATIGTVAGNVVSYTDGTVSAGQTVVYEVGAVNSNGTTGALSLPVTGYPYAPMTITNFQSTDSSSAVTLSWIAPSVITWGPLAYNVVRTTLAGGSPTTLATNSASVTDSSGALGQAYIYTVTATDAHNHTSLAAGPVTDGPLNPPATPTPVIATAGNQQILIDWAPSAPVSASLPVSEYILTGTDGVSVVLPASQTSYLDGPPNSVPLANGLVVTYSIQAIDATGNPVGNHLSQSVTGGPVTTSQYILNSPTGLAVTATSPTNNLLSWTRPNDEGYPVTAYNIYRSNSFTTVLGSPIATIANPALNPVTVYDDTTVSPSTTYYYVITALYSQPTTVGGPTQSPPSNHAFDKTPAPAAGVPPVTAGVMAFDANLLKPLTGQVLTIYFISNGSGPAELDVYNVSGNPIRALYATSVAGAKETVVWDGKDRNGNTVASGVYMIEIKTAGLHQVKKVLVVK